MNSKAIIILAFILILTLSLTSCALFQTTDFGIIKLPNIVVYLILICAVIYWYVKRHK
jgi:hypothetical protein